ncbi:hypothetical protein [Flagellimonas lutimaris]|uniref:hypothetical protein n=1 Tax=Flagellimonas lutimaris TaxID=475082 RepID=UPI003F5CF178
MIRLKLTWRYLLAFYCIIMLYSSLHELVHHFVGYFICGEWGTKSFNRFSMACNVGKITYLATYAGPLFSFIMMYVGTYFLKKGASDFKKHLGFAMIFAQLPLQRMVMPMFGMNDELFASVHIFGNTYTTYAIVTIVIWAICIPPLIVAYRAISNKRKMLWFLFYLILLPYIIWGPFFGILEYVMVDMGILSQSIIGIGLLFIINELVTIVGYLCVKKYINPNR